MNTITTYSHQPWNKGKLVGQKAPPRLRDIWAIRVRLQIADKTRDLALFDLAIDSKLRACDLTRLRVRDVAHGKHVASRAIVMQKKTQRPVQFEITEQTRTALETWIHRALLRSEDYLFPSRLHASEHLSTRQYARIVEAWVKVIGLDPAMYGTHTVPISWTFRMKSLTAGLWSCETISIGGISRRSLNRSWALLLNPALATYRMSR